MDVFARSLRLCEGFEAISKLATAPIKSLANSDIRQGFLSLVE